jgi:DNA-binding transcriptional MerR regulator
VTTPNLMTLAEVAEATRVAPGTLRYWRHIGGRGPRSFKPGRRVVYMEADVIAWLEETRDGDGPTESASR